jgi:hypothetical protein
MDEPSSCLVVLTNRKGKITTTAKAWAVAIASSSECQKKHCIADLGVVGSKVS